MVFPLNTFHPRHHGNGESGIQISIRPEVQAVVTGHGVASTGVIIPSAECLDSLLASIWRTFESVLGDLK